MNPCPQRGGIVFVRTAAHAGAARSGILLTAIKLTAVLVYFVGSITACDNDMGSLLLPRPTLGIQVDPGAPTNVESGTNEVLEMAQWVDTSSGPQLIAGRLSSSGDVDVYDLGPVRPGDRVRVELQSGRGLPAAFGLFDDSGATLLINDHRNVYLGRQGPFVDLTARRASSSCLVAIASTPGYDATGGYTLAASIEFPASIPQPRPDVFILDFSGGRNVKIGSRSAINVPSFDAANISPDFRGQTSAMVSQVVNRVREQFAPYDITILSTSEGPISESSASRIYFGAFDSALLGVAEGVDEYNATRSQNAIVFTDTFEVFNSIRPTVAGMSQAMANVAAHEIGHLLGLVHTQDPRDIMDVTASLRQLMQVQAFGRAPIYSTVFPLGQQDSAQLLLDAIGGDENMARAAASVVFDSKDPVWQKSSEVPARDLTILGGCHLHEH